MPATPEHCHALRLTEAALTHRASKFGPIRARSILFFFPASHLNCARANIPPPPHWNIRRCTRHHSTSVTPAALYAARTAPGASVSHRLYNTADARYNIHGKASELAHRGMTPSQEWPKSGQLGPKLPKSSRIRAKFGRKRPNSSRVRPNLAEAGQSKPNMSKVRQKSPKLGPWANLGSNRTHTMATIKPKLDCYRQKSVDPGRIGEIRTKFGRSQPNLDESSQSGRYQARLD